MEFVNDMGPWEVNKGLLHPKGIVIHGMGQFVNGLYASQFLKSIKYSAHFFIDPNGKIVMGAPLSSKARHAGVSEHNDLKNLNSFYLGVELLVPGHHDLESLYEAMKKPNCYTEEQYLSLAELCAWLHKEYMAIDLHSIVSHSQVAGDEIRGKGKGKQDPGEGFNRKYFEQLFEREVCR